MSDEERYVVARALGRGGMGAVYLAHDSLLGRVVALKRAQRYEAADLLRFKREFRAIERLVHPSLVRLHELGADAQGLYYTMEALEGVDLGAYCRAGDPVERLLDVLPQLLGALEFLHAHGVVHCDLKPGNVLVTEGGALKLLDFGVLSELAGEADDVAGTPAYMAPERVRGEAATPATDAYALGCTMFEVLTGRTPFVGSRLSVLAAHVTRAPPHATELASEVPAPLAALCHALLAKDPVTRLTLGALADGLPGAVARLSSKSAKLASELVLGRHALQARLLRHLEAEPRPLVLSGPSGVGKSTMLEWLGREARRRGALVLRGASRSTELLPYNALDAAIDDLSRALTRCERPIDHRAQRLAAEAFPLLRAPSASMDEARERVRQGLFGFREELDRCTRREVFDAIATLLDTAAGGSDVLLLIDDSQWADEDSIALIRHVLDHSQSPLRVVLVLRDDVEPGPAHALVETLNAVAVEVSPLDEETTLALVRRAAAGAGAVPTDAVPTDAVPTDAVLTDAVLAEAARACEGRPFFAEIAGRALARGERATLDDLVSSAWAAHREVLALLVTADGWTPNLTLADLLGASLGALDDRLRQLESEGLVRRSGHLSAGETDLYHDGIRRAALDRLDPTERSALHGRLADHLLQAGEASPQRLVRHLASAGRTREAVTHARTAAARAERQRAFSLAADMYEVVLAHAPGERSVREARAWALERSSRYAAAADEWAALARGAEPEVRLDIGLHEAHALIAASRAGEGIERLDAALAASGQGPVRVRGLGAVATIVRFLLGPARRAARAEPSSALRVRAERHLKIGILLAFLEPITGMTFLQRARADFLRAGADAQVAGCDYVFAILAFLSARDPDRVPLAERYLAGARERGRGVEAPPDVRGMDPFVEGLRGMRRGHWRDARASFERAEQIFRESTGTTEVTMARSWMMMMAAHMQDMHEVRRLRDQLRRQASDSGGTLLLVHIALVDGYVQMLEGRFDESFEVVTRGADLFDDDPPNAQRAALLTYRHGADIYRDDARRARRELTVAFARARRFRFMSTMYAGTYGVIAALVEANALRAGDPAASARKIERLARIIDRSPPLWAGGSWRARAYAADAAGRPEQALSLLRRAEGEAARYDRRVDVAIAQWQLGRRLGGDEGALLRSRAEASVAALDVSPLALEEDAGLR